VLSVDYSKAFRTYTYRCPHCGEDLDGSRDPYAGDLTVCHACLKPSRFAWTKGSNRGGLDLVPVVLDALPQGDRLEVKNVIERLKEKKHGTA
jgi:hypothetical protein